MKNSTLRSILMSLFLIVALAGCGPSYLGVGTGYGYGSRYGYGYSPYAYGYRPPVVIAPRPYYARPYYRAPNYGYRYNAPRSYGGGGSFGGRRGRW